MKEDAEFEAKTKVKFKAWEIENRWQIGEETKC